MLWCGLKPAIGFIGAGNLGRDSGPALSYLFGAIKGSILYSCFCWASGKGQAAYQVWLSPAPSPGTGQQKAWEFWELPLSASCLLAQSMKEPLVVCDECEVVSHWVTTYVISGVYQVDTDSNSVPVLHLRSFISCHLPRVCRLLWWSWVSGSCQRETRRVHQSKIDQDLSVGKEGSTQERWCWNVRENNGPCLGAIQLSFWHSPGSAQTSSTAFHESLHYGSRLVAARWLLHRSRAWQGKDMGSLEGATSKGSTS